MKKILLSFLLVTVFSSTAFSETWICSYTFDNVSETTMYERKGNYFKVYAQGAYEYFEKIIFEDDEYIAIGDLGYYDSIESNAFHIQIIEKLTGLYNSNSISVPSSKGEFASLEGKCFVK